METIELKNKITASELMQIMEEHRNVTFKCEDLQVTASLEKERISRKKIKSTIFVSLSRYGYNIKSNTSNDMEFLLYALNNPEEFGTYDYGYCACDEHNKIVKCFGVNPGAWRIASNYAEKNGLNDRFTMDGEIYLSQDDYNLKRGKRLLETLNSEELKGLNLLKEAMKSLKDGYMLSIITSDNTEYIFQKGADELERVLNRIIESTIDSTQPIPRKFIETRLAISTHYHEYTTGDGEDPDDYHYEEGVNNCLFDYICTLALDNIKEATVIPFDLRYFANKAKNENKTA